MKTARFILLWIWCLAYMAFGIPVKLAVDAKPEENITRTDFFRIYPVTKLAVYLASSSTTEVVLDLAPGDYEIKAASMNAVGWGLFSDPLQVVIPIPLPPAWSIEGNILTTGDGDRIKLVIQFSDSLKNWTDRPSPSARFFRIQATSPTP